MADGLNCGLFIETHFPPLFGHLRDSRKDDDDFGFRFVVRIVPREVVVGWLSTAVEFFLHLFLP